MLIYNKNREMRKQFVGLTVLLLSACGFFFSCNNIVNNKGITLEFDSIQINETAHLFGDTAKPACNLTVEFTYISGPSTQKGMTDTLNRYFQTACFGDRYTDMTPVEAVNAYKEKYVSDYRNDLESYYTKDMQNQEENASIGAWYSYYKHIVGNVQLCQSDLLVYRVYYEEYTGGAHGIYVTNYLNIDRENQSLIQLDNLFEGDYKEQLAELLTARLMADNHVSSRQELEELGYLTAGDLEPTENFYMDDKGITFHYNVYEIAPYVMGAVNITLSYDALEPLMKENARK